MKITKTISENLENLKDLSGTFREGDVISFDLKDREHVEAMAVKEEADGMIFCLVDCLAEEMAMNNRETNKGGYAGSKLRTALRDKILPRFPNDLAENMVPFDNGDLLRLPTEKEIFGENIFGEKEPETVKQWAPMKLRRNRIAFQGHNGNPEWYWLQNAARDVVSSTYCAGVNTDGFALCLSASGAWVGVRPAFKIRNL